MLRRADIYYETILNFGQKTYDFQQPHVQISSCYGKIIKDDEITFYLYFLIQPDSIKLSTFPCAM